MKKVNRIVVVVVLLSMIAVSSVIAKCKYCTHVDTEITYLDYGENCTVVFSDAPACAISQWRHKCVYPEPKTYVTITGVITGYCSVSGPFTQDFANCKTLIFSCEDY